MNRRRGALKVMRWLRQIRCSESGSAMVETALTFPISLLRCSLEQSKLGDLAYKANEVTNSARAAAQYAAAVGGGYTDCDEQFQTSLRQPLPQRNDVQQRAECTK